MHRHSQLLILILCALLLLLVCISYREVPSYSYTEIDAPTLLRVNQIDEPLDIARLFGREFRDEIHPGVRFYRPLTTLSYALQQYFFGIEPAGMHRVDIALHAVNAMLILFFCRALGLHLAASALCAFLFALHPLGNEVVPALERRGDLLAVLLIVSSATARLRGRRWLALLLGAVAPLAKETAFLLPLVWAAQRPFRLRESLREAFVGLAVVMPALIARTLVVGGAGGYSGARKTLEGLPSSLLTLFDPFRLYGAWPARALFLLLLLALLFVWWRRRTVAIQLGVLWLGTGLLMTTLGGQVSAWYLYASLPPAMLLLGSLAHALWPVQGERLWRPAAVLPALPAVALSVCILVPSPLWTRYPEWAETSRLLELWDRELLRHVRSGAMSEDEPVVLLGVPSRVGQGPSARFFTRAASVALSYTLQDDLRLRHGINLPVWCAVQVHVHGIGSRYEMLVEQEGEEIWVRASGPVVLDGADRLAIWRQTTVAPYEMRREPEEGAIVLRDVLPPIWRWNGEELVLWRPAR